MPLSALRGAIGAAVFFVPGVLLGAMCALDVVPAATLFLPYFEVDLSEPQGATTTVTLTNVTDEPTVVHTTLWTDWGEPTIDFDIFFTGHDVVVFDLRALFAGGLVPITADAVRDPDDLISPHGDHPEWDGTFPSCDGILPLPPVQAALRQYLVESHTGQPLTLVPGRCQGEDHGDQTVRGYITFDVMSGCALLYPSDPGYFVEGGAGLATDENRLLGEVELSNAVDGTAASMPLVHIEAHPGFAPASGATFYGRLVNNSGSDDREPLGSVWSIRYREDSPSVTTGLLVWRDPTAEGSLSFPGFDCSAGPAWRPLDETEVRCFSESSDLDIVCGSGGTDCFPIVTQEIAVSSLAVPFTGGVCELDLNHHCPGCSPGGLGTEQSVAQSLVVSRVVETPGISLAMSLINGAMLASACDEAPIPFPLLFADGFESGDTNAWAMP